MVQVALIAMEAAVQVSVSVKSPVTGDLRHGERGGCRYL